MEFRLPWVSEPLVLRAHPVHHRPDGEELLRVGLAFEELER